MVAVTSSTTQIVKKHAKYVDYSVNYVKTVNFGLVEEVEMTLLNTKTQVVDTKVV